MFVCIFKKNDSTVFMLFAELRKFSIFWFYDLGHRFYLRFVVKSGDSAVWWLEIISSYWSCSMQTWGDVCNSEIFLNCVFIQYFITLMCCIRCLREYILGKTKLLNVMITIPIIFKCYYHNNMSPSKPKFRWKPKYQIMTFKNGWY